MKRLAVVVLLLSTGCVPSLEELLPFSCAQDFTCPAGLACVADEGLQYLCAAPELGKSCQPDTDCGRAREGAVCHVVDATERPTGLGFPGGPIRVCAATPGAPETIELVREGTTVRVSWTAPIDTGGLPITGHEVTTNPKTVVFPPLPGTSVVTFVVEEGKTYDVQVVALNALGKGPSRSDSITIHPPSEPGAPRDVVATSGVAEASVTWKPPLDDGGRTITAYEVTLSPGPTFQVSGSNTSTTAGRLRAGTGYTFTVRAINEMGKGPASAPSNRVVPTARPPSPPWQIEATPGGRRVALSWLTPFDDGGGDVTHYDVTVSPGGRTITVPAPAPASAEDGPASVETTVDGLTEFETYTFAITATNAAGTSDPATSDPVQVQPDVPAAPQHVVATAGPGSAVVTWEAPNDDGGTPVTAYRVHASHGAWREVSSAARDDRFDGLTRGAAVTFTVVALNSAGMGPASVPSNAVIPTAVPPHPPSQVEAVPGGRRVELSWLSPVDDGGSDVTHYDVTVTPGGRTLTVPSPDLASPEDGATRVTVTVDELAAGTVYAFAITAANAGGISESVTTAPVTVLPDFPTAPLAVTGKAFAEAAVVTWEAPADDGGAPITSYRVRSSTGEAKEADGAARAVRFDGLATGVDLTFTITAFNAAGESPASAPTHAVIPRCRRGFATDPGVTLGEYLKHVVTVDLDGDGLVDTVSVQVHQTDVSVRMGVAGGGFSAVRSFDTGSGLSVSGLAVADMNADGHPDLVTATMSGWGIDVFLNKGDGDFLPPLRSAGPFSGAPMQVVDVDGDGKLDLVSGSCRWPGNGDGSVGSRQCVAGIEHDTSTTGDLNGDGLLDLVVASRSENRAQVFLNTGGIGMGAPLDLHPGQYPVAVAIADFDQDGHADLAIANNGFQFITNTWIPGTLTYYRGKGNGTFHSPQTVPVWDKPESLEAADMNGDGAPDLVVGHGGYERNLVSILLSNPEGGFHRPVGTAAAREHRSLQIVDVNGDGHPDVAVGDRLGGELRFLINDGSGTFPGLQLFDAGYSVDSVATGDMDGDGVIDLVTADRMLAGVRIHRRTTSPIFATSEGHSGAEPVGPALSDFDGDGKLDVAVATESDGKVWLFLGNGDGTVQAASTITAGGKPASIAAGDLDGDGHTDLVLSNSSGRPRWLRGKGDGSFHGAVEFPFNEPTQQVVLADLDANGRLDVILSGGPGSANGVLLIQSNDGTFKQYDGPGGDQMQSMTARDLDGDGFIDVASASSSGSSVSMSTLYAGQSGRFEDFAPAYSKVPVDDGVPLRVALACGDFNDDGRPDLVFASTWRDAAFIPGTGPRLWDTPQTLHLPVRIHVAASADVDGDGLPEFVFGMESGIVGIARTTCAR